MLEAIHLPPNYTAKPKSLEGRVIIVTGATAGLGRAAAIAFASAGATVVLHGRNQAKLDALYDQIEALPAPQPAIMQLDFLKATQAELDAFAQTIEAKLGRIDGIFHGASHFSPLMPLAMQNLDIWLQHSRVNLAVPAALTKACLPMLLAAPDASVIFLTETHALTPTAYWAPFAPVKSSLDAMVATWQSELPKPCNLRLNLLFPGPVSSPFRGKTHPGEAQTATPNIESLCPAFLFLMGKDSVGLAAKVLHCT
jgi:NAD(P)-dependent dehydrogenase (short-subunit alcohol dehydrogenase family)